MHADLYIVCNIYRVGRMHYESSRKPSGQSFRRPHAVGVLNLSEIIIKKREGETTSNIEKELTMKIYQGEEKDFHSLHEVIIKKSGRVNIVAGPSHSGNNLQIYK